MPNPITLADTVSIDASTEDPDGEAATLRIRWLVNGRVIEGETAPTLNPRILKRGDRLSAEVTPVDLRGATGPTYPTGPVNVANTPPVVAKVEIEPRAAVAGDRLSAKVEGSDTDGDPIRYVFQWWRNNRPVAAPAGDKEVSALETAGFARGDTIVVGATPYDAAGAGKLVTSEPLVLSNRAPTITSAPTGAITQGRFEYTVTATDPDEDPLTYKLNSAPPGMTIDSGTGQIVWQVPPDVKGPQQVRISVDDGHEGLAFQEFSLTPPAATP